jgi:pimeloyl-ACP methyl ester carboxylesterase
MGNHSHFSSHSRHQPDLNFTDKAPGRAAYFELSFGDYSLEARVLYNQQGQEPWVLSVHGARSDYTKANAVSFGLQARGYSLLGMSMSGHSKAGVLAPEQTSLGQNVREVAAFFDDLDRTRKKVVIGYSLGGTPALKLLERHAADIDKLVLFYPALYSREAYDQPFGQAFRQAISQPYSYRQNDTIGLLRAFPGKLLLVKGQYDGLDPEAYGQPAGTAAGDIQVGNKEYYSPIPKEVIDMVYGAVAPERRQFIEIPDCGHSVVLWLRDHPAAAEQLLDQIDAFLKS